MNLLPTYKELVSAAIITAGVTFVAGKVEPLATPLTGLLPEGVGHVAVIYVIVLAGQKVGNMI